MSNRAVLEKKEMKLAEDKTSGVMRIVIQDFQNKREIVIASFKKSNKKNFMEKLAMRIFRFLKKMSRRFIEIEATDTIYWSSFPDVDNDGPWEKTWGK